MSLRSATMTPMPATTDNQRVLVVDGEENIADVIAMALRYQGFAVETAGTESSRSRGQKPFSPLGSSR